MEKLKTAARSLGRYFNDNFKRFLSLVLCVCVVAGVFRVSSVKAHAAAPALLPVGVAAAGTYMTMTGMPLRVIAGGASAASVAITSAAGSYAAATGAAASGEALLTAVGAGVSVSPAGIIILTAASAALLAGFCAWLYENHLVDTDTYSIINDKYIQSPALGNFYLSNATWQVSPSVGQLEQGNIISLGSSFSGSLSTPGGIDFFIEDNYLKYINLDGGTNVAFYLRDATAPFSIYLAYNFASDNVAAGAFQAFYFKNNGDLGNSESFSFREIVGDSSLFGQSVSVSNDGYELITVPDNMSLGIDVGNPDLSIETLPEFIPDEIAAGSLSAAPSIIAPPVVEEDIDFNPALPDFADPVIPENPGTGAPFLPSTLAIPWHYVVKTLDYALSFISLAMVAFSNMLPTSAQIVVWAAVVLAVVFGLLRRFLG